MEASNIKAIKLYEYALKQIDLKDKEIKELKKKIDEYERQPELMAETASEALQTLQEQDAEIAELRKRLKVADEALEKCVNYNNSWELEAAEENAKNVLAAIRWKEEANNGK